MTKLFKAILNMEASFFSKPLNQSECRIKITSQLLSESECRNVGHDLTQTNKMAEAQHNADKHYLFFKNTSMLILYKNVRFVLFTKTSTDTADIYLPNLTIYELNLWAWPFVLSHLSFP